MTVEEWWELFCLEWALIGLHHSIRQDIFKSLTREKVPYDPSTPFWEDKP